MNTMLEPRIVAARIQRPARSAPGASARSDRTTASSHGGFITLTALDHGDCQYPTKMQMQLNWLRTRVKGSSKPIWSPLLFCEDVIPNTGMSRLGRYT